MTSTNHIRLRALRRGLWIAVALAVVGVGGATLWNLNLQREQVAPAANQALGIGGPFTLTDTNGQPFPSSKLNGKPFAIFFGFTRCPDVCPTSLANIARYRKALAGDGDKFSIVFVSVDGERDTPSELKHFLTLFDAPIIGLSGTPEQTAIATKAYKVFFAKVPTGPGDYTIDHTASIFLMDGRGQFVSTIAHGEADEMALAKLRRLIS